MYVAFLVLAMLTAIVAVFTFNIFLIGLAIFFGLLAWLVQAEAADRNRRRDQSSSTKTTSSPGDMPS